MITVNDENVGQQKLHKIYYLVFGAIVVVHLMWSSFFQCLLTDRKYQQSTSG